MDVASQAYNCGAASVIAVDIQKPAAFGKEMETAIEKGTQIVWPKFSDRYDHNEKRLYFKDGSSLDADLVIMSVGDIPILQFLSAGHPYRTRLDISKRERPDHRRKGLRYRRCNQVRTGNTCYRPGNKPQPKPYIISLCTRLAGPRSNRSSPMNALRPNTMTSAVEILPRNRRRINACPARYMQGLPYVRDNLLLGRNQQGRARGRII